jgi:hypothetical protein
MDTDQIILVDSSMEVPEACPTCAVRLRYEFWDEEPDTGMHACRVWRCNKCGLSWEAPRKEYSND